MKSIKNGFQEAERNFYILMKPKDNNLNLLEKSGACCIIVIILSKQNQLNFLFNF